ncbi:MAG TPA: LPS export ABC transporter periplasmic protein LptC [bacterium]|nr:LPS export ABC transporter periplasmic protein LptC [bacterium]
MTLLRRGTLWAIPIVLLAALAWSVLPWGGTRPDTTPRPPSVTSPRTDGSASPDDGAPAQRSDGTRRPVNADQGVGSASQGIPNGEIRSGHLVDTDAAGRRRWQITADDVALAQEGRVVHLRNVHAVFYNPDGTTMTVTGKRGVYDTSSKEVQMSGDVHGVSANGRQIFADQLSYSPATERVTGIGNIRVVEERVIMYSDRMVSDTNLGQTQFFGHVHMTVR